MATKYKRSHLRDFAKRSGLTYKQAVRLCEWAEAARPRVYIGNSFHWGVVEQGYALCREMGLPRRIEWSRNIPRYGSYSNPLPLIT